jgi:hypothetical protein
MQKFHSITEGSTLKQPRIFDVIYENDTIPSSAKHNAINCLIQAFKTKLIRWVVHVSVAFDQVESQHFCEIMLEANGALEQSGCVPTHNTIREWIIKD